MKNYIRILIVVGIIAVGGFAIYRGTSRALISAPTLSSLPTESATPTPLVTPVSVSYAPAPKDWKTYSSASMNFSVSYPKDWHVGGCGAECVGWAPPTLASTQFALGIIESSGSLNDLLAKADPYLVKKEDVKVGNLDWIKLTLRQPQTGAAVTSHFIVKGTKIYEFGTATSDAAIIAVYGQMIYSFRFLK